MRTDSNSSPIEGEPVPVGCIRYTRSISTALHRGRSRLRRAIALNGQQSAQPAFRQDDLP
jgi:hypothetical protein